MKEGKNYMRKKNSEGALAGGRGGTNRTSLQNAQTRISPKPSWWERVKIAFKSTERNPRESSVNSVTEKGKGG